MHENLCRHTSQQVNTLNMIYNNLKAANIQTYGGFSPGAESTLAIPIT